MSETPITPRTNELAKIFVGTSVALIAADFVVLSCRLGVRIRNGLALLVDDWLVIVGLIFACTCWALEVAGAARYMYPSDEHQFVTDEDAHGILRSSFLSFTFWGVAICCIKVSVLLTLLRLKDSFWWKGFLRLLIFVQVAFTIGDCTYQWAKYPVLTSQGCAVDGGDPCQEIYAVLTYVESAFQIGIEVIISILPVTFLVQLRRPLWEKLLIGFLMSIGLLACTFSIRKAIMNQSFADVTISFVDLNIALFTYNCAELFIGIIAACLFGLKAPFYRLLKMWGIDIHSMVHRTFQTADDLPDFHLTADSGKLDKDEAHETRTRLSRFSLFEEAGDTSQLRHERNLV